MLRRDNVVPDLIWHGEADGIDPKAYPTNLSRKGHLMAYRKRKGADTWHFCRNCSNWPTSDYVEQVSKPTTGELCNECKAKKESGNCR